MSTASTSLQGRTPQFSQDKVAPANVLKFRPDKETDEHRLENRRKQIQFGKNTVGYDNYIAAIPKPLRKRIPAHPRTPDITKDMSKRQFDGIVKAWRRALHTWDVPDIRPDLNPEAVKLQVKQPKAVEFDESRNIGQKRKITQDNSSEGDHESNKVFVREGTREETEEHPENFTIGETFLDDGYVSGEGVVDDDDDDVL